MTNLRQRIACKAVIVYDSKILILREAPSYKDGTNIGKYHLPGGRIEPGENFMSGLLREVKEETGLEVMVNRPVFVGEWRPLISGEQNQIVAIFFACQSNTNVVTLSEEHDRYSWVSPEDYDRGSLMPPDDKAIDAYLDTVAGCSAEWQKPHGTL